MDHHFSKDGEFENCRPVSTKKKLFKLLEHWINHNEEHAKTYLEWSKRAGEEELE